MFSIHDGAENVAEYYFKLTFNYIYELYYITSSDLFPETGEA